MNTCERDECNKLSTRFITGGAFPAGAPGESYYRNRCLEHFLIKGEGVPITRSVAQERWGTFLNLWEIDFFQIDDGTYYQSLTHCRTRNILFALHGDAVEHSKRHGRNT